MATTLSRHWCHLTVTLHIFFVNCTDPSPSAPGQTGLSDAEFLVKIAKWKEQIEAFWNCCCGYRVWRCCPVTFTVVTKVPRKQPELLIPTPRGYHRIEVVRGTGTSSTGIGPASQSGTWDENDNKYVVAHEAGHLLGLRDEYGDVVNSQVTAPLLERCAEDECIMKIKHPPVHVPAVHIDEILTKLDASCGWLCRFLGRFFRRPPSSST